jgi:hypothetical protein
VFFFTWQPFTISPLRNSQSLRKKIALPVSFLRKEIDKNTVEAFETPCLFFPEERRDGTKEARTKVHSTKPLHIPSSLFSVGWW